MKLLCLLHLLNLQQTLHKGHLCLSNFIIHSKHRLCLHLRVTIMVSYLQVGLHLLGRAHLLRQPRLRLLLRLLHGTTTPNRTAISRHTRTRCRSCPPLRLYLYRVGVITDSRLLPPNASIEGGGTGGSLRHVSRSEFIKIYGCISSTRPPRPAPPRL